MPSLEFPDREQAPTYVVSSDGTNFYVKICATGAKARFSDAITALHWCRDNGPALGTVVQIKPPFSTTGELVIANRSNITFKTDVLPHVAFETDPQIVYIRSILLESTTASVWNITLQGIFTQQLQFHSTNASYSIMKVRCKDLRIYATDQADRRGIIFNVENGYAEEIFFNHCRFYQWTCSADHGFITVQNGGAGALYFLDCTAIIRAGAANRSFIHTRVNTSLGHTHFTNLFILTYENVTPYSLVNISANTEAYNGPSGLEFIGGYWELDEDITLLTFAAATAEQICGVIFDDVFYNINTGKTVTLINMLNANWVAGWSHSATFKGEKMRGGAIVVGTPAQTALFNVYIDILGFNPVAASTPAVGASPVTFGPYPYKMQISVVGGDITSVTNRGQVTGQTGANTARDYMLYAGDTCVIVYAVAPTVYLQPQ